MYGRCIKVDCFLRANMAFAGQNHIKSSFIRRKWHFGGQMGLSMNCIFLIGWLCLGMVNMLSDSKDYVLYGVMAFRDHVVWSMKRENCAYIFIWRKHNLKSFILCMILSKSMASPLYSLTALSKTHLGKNSITCAKTYLPLFIILSWKQPQN